MSSFINISESFALEGQILLADLPERAKAFGGLLYLCPDTNGDDGVLGGTFGDALFAFEGRAFHVPYNPQSLATQPSADPKDENKRVLHALALYGAIADSLSKLGEGGNRALISCKSNRRAGCAYACFNFVTNHLHEDLDAFLVDCKAKGLTFVDSEPMALWLQTVVEWKRKSGSRPLVLRQLFEKASSTYTYLLYDEANKDGILIDPVKETAQRDAKLVGELGVTLKYALNTHVHADHITGTGLLKTLLSPPPASAISRVGGAVADVLLDDDDVLTFANGRRHVFVLSTPGHTVGCLSFVVFDPVRTLVFTGDALLIRGCGRTDFQGGSAASLYDAVHSRLFTLPASALVLPAHNYDGLPFSTIGEERTLNPRLTKSKEEFIDIMANLNLPPPAKLDESVPANLQCGV